MKKLLYALSVLFVSALVFTSCKKDKDDPSLVGKWGLYESSYKYVEGSDVYQDTEVITPNHEDYYTCEFTADGKVFVEGNATFQATYRIEGNKLYTKENGSTVEDSYEFSLTENELVLTDKDQGNGWSEEEVEKFKRL